MLVEALIAGALLGTGPIGDVDARLKEGAMLVQASRYAEAESILRSVIPELSEADPRRGPALNNLGAALYSSGQIQGVEQYYAGALAAIGNRSPEQTAAIKNNLATL